MASRKEMINQTMGYSPGKKKEKKGSKRADFVSAALQGVKATNGKRKLY